MARPVDPTKRAPNGRYLSEIRWIQENRSSRSNTYYLSVEDRELVRRAGRKLKLKKNSEIIRAALTLALEA